LYSYQVTFTPTSGNYRTMTANVNVGVSSQITFNMNGGNISGSTADVIRNAPYEGVVTPPANPTRTSYTFSGWCTTTSNTTPFNLNYVTSNATVYARWISTSTVTAVTNVTNSATDMAMVYVGGGSYSFQFDSTTNRSLITLSSFYIGKYEVTQEQFQSVMNKNPSQFTSSPASGETQTKRPVESVSFYDALEFCNTLSTQKGLNPVYTMTGTTVQNNHITSATVAVDWTKNGYRLPTWAEWQYAAKGGPLMSNPAKTYAGSNTWSDVGWFGNNSPMYGSTTAGNSGGITHEVGKKAANELGTYDMTGNVFEWCWDMFNTFGVIYNNYSSTEVNPRGPATGTYRMVCSGSYFNGPNSETYAVWTQNISYAGYITKPSSMYGEYVTVYQSNMGNIGFRVVRNAN